MAINEQFNDPITPEVTDRARNAAYFLNNYFDEDGKPLVEFLPRGLEAVGFIIRDAGEEARSEIRDWWDINGVDLNKPEE